MASAVTRPGGIPPDEVLEWTVRLGRALRSEGVPCTPVETLAAAEAVRHLDLDDPRDAYLGLRCVFLSERADEPAFERVFWRMWGRPPRDETEPVGPDPWRPRLLARPGRRGTGIVPEGAPEGVRRGRGDEGAEERARTATDPQGARVGAAYTPRESLARRSFASLGEQEMRELDHLFDRLIVKLATRRSRRLRPARRRGRVDIRRSFRGALGHDGEMVRLARRARRTERPRVVLLCDVSGSMERYSRFLVRFLLATRRTRDVETFVFSTRLVRLTPWISGSRPEEALAALGERVPGWSGGTRIGASLEDFLDRFGRTMLGQRTVVIVLSDGLDQGEVEPLERAMAGIRRKCRKLIWLNPLLESPDYRPQARGMRAALPYVDEFAPGHSLEALRELVALIRL